MTSSWDDSRQVRWLTDQGVDLFRGSGRLIGARRVEVTDKSGAVTGLQARRAVVLATGTTAAMPPVDGLADARPWDNRAVTAAKALPARLLVIGGGAIGVEMAQGYRRLGTSEVTVIEGSPLGCSSAKSRSPGTRCAQRSRPRGSPS